MTDTPPIHEVLDFTGTKGVASFEGRSADQSASASSESLSLTKAMGSDTTNLHQVVSSHLTPARSRSDSSIVSKNNVKRVKRNFRSGNEESALKQLEEARSAVHDVIISILREDRFDYGYSYYYQKVEAICKYKHAEQGKLGDFLVSNIQQFFEDDVKVQVVAIVNDNSVSTNDFVSRYLQIYNSWESRLRSLSKVCLYLDRSYLLPHPNKKMILESGIDLFIDELLASNTAEGKHTLQKYAKFLDECLREEMANPNTLNALQSFTKILIKLNFKKKIRLNNEIIDQCVTTINDLKVGWFNDHKSYIHLCLKNVSKIVTFFKECGQSKDFNEKLLLKLKWVTIFADFDTIIGNCLPYMLMDEADMQLHMVFKLCELTPKEYNLESIPIFVNQWGKLIHQQVVTLLNKSMSENNGSVISELVEMFEKYRNTVTVKFKDNEKFEFEIRHSFSKSINLNKKVNLFIINQLCKSTDAFFKRKLPTNFQEFEERFMTVFKFLNNKIDFINNYKIQLARRLLLSKNVSINMEKKLVDSIMKVVGENDDTIGLNVMFKDLDYCQAHFSSVHNIAPKSVDFSALVLEKKHWPDIPRSDTLPVLGTPFGDILKNFETLYKSSDDKLKNHRLDWGNYNLHQLVIVGHFDSGDYELNVNLLQASVIYMFNDSERLTLQQLHETTGMDSKLTRRIISSLSDKYKILIEEGDSIKFNNSFSDKSRKLKIPLPRDKDTSSMGVSADKDKVVVRNRDAELRGALIRIMKMEARLTYTELISKVMDQVNANGPVSISDIKSNIEFLITKEYISREMDTKTLCYIP